MVTTAASYVDSRYRTYPDAYDGVVRVSFAGYYGTGALLFDGRAVLTAAHLFAGRTGTAVVGFETDGGTESRSVAQIVQHPGFDAASNNDLAILWLASAAPVQATRYGLYRHSDEIGQAFSLVGYGRHGAGSTGVAGATTGDMPRLKASNQFDAEGATLKVNLGAVMAWTPLSGTQLVADFDNGMAGNDALGRLIGRSDLGLGADEGLIAPGDSGGPAFIADRIAGVASYITSLASAGVDPDIDQSANSSFGEIAAWQRVSAYQQWIDQSLRANYPDAPTSPENVQQSVPEGNAGTVFAYFLLQFAGERTQPGQILSVDYATRDGTAVAGSDYLPVSGRLNLYPGENQAVIPVEILGDTRSEPDEVFYLEVFNPVGGTFGEGVAKLVAARTVLNDDGAMG